MQNELLDLVIGVVFVWFLLSMLASAISEGIALALRVRAKFLWKGIRHLLDPVEGPLSNRWRQVSITVPRREGEKKERAEQQKARRKKDHSKALDRGKLVDPRPKVTRPGTEKSNTAVGADATLDQRVAHLYDALRPALVEVGREHKFSKVTRIASDLFADAVVSAARPVTKRDLATAAKEKQWDEAAIDRLSALLTDFELSEALTFKTMWEGKSADEEAKKQRKQQWKALATESEARRLFNDAKAILTLDDVEAFVAKNPELAAAVQRAASTVLDNSAEQIAAVKTTIENWYDREMAQVSALYRRHNRKILLILAFPIALAFQANAIGIALDLRHDANLRQAIVAEATNRAAQNDVNAVCTPTDDDTTTTTTAATTTTTASTTTTATQYDQAVDRYNCASTIVALSSRFGVGFGLQAFRTAHERAVIDEASPQRVPTAEELKDADYSLDDIKPFLTEDWGWIGMPLTMVALTFGAQFWLQALQRLIGLRKMVGAGPNA
jgi:hypothetical protein